MSDLNISKAPNDPLNIERFSTRLFSPIWVVELNFFHPIYYLEANQHLFQNLGFWWQMLKRLYICLGYSSVVGYCSARLA